MGNEWETNQKSTETDKFLNVSKHKASGRICFENLMNFVTPGINIFCQSQKYVHQLLHTVLLRFISLLSYKVQ